MIGNHSIKNGKNTNKNKENGSGAKSRKNGFIKRIRFGSMKVTRKFMLKIMLTRSLNKVMRNIMKNLKKVNRNYNKARNL